MINVRGGCDQMSLDLSGPCDGFNNAATARVGEWLGAAQGYIPVAQAIVERHGPEGLKAYLINEMYQAHTRSGPGRIYREVGQDGLEDEVDWAQLAFGLLGVEEDRHGEHLARWHANHKA